MSGNDTTTVDALSFRTGAKRGCLYERIIELYEIANRIDNNPRDKDALLNLRQWIEGAGIYEQFCDFTDEG